MLLRELINAFNARTRSWPRIAFASAVAGSVLAVIAVMPPDGARSLQRRALCAEDAVVKGVVSATTRLDSGRVGVLVGVGPDGASRNEARLAVVEVNDQTVVTGIRVGDGAIDPRVFEGDPVWARGCENRITGRFVAKRLSITFR